MTLNSFNLSCPHVVVAAGDVAERVSAQDVAADDVTEDGRQQAFLLQPLSHALFRAT